MTIINGKTFNPSPMTWGQRKQARSVLASHNARLADKAEKLDKAQKTDDPQALAEALAGLTFIGFENRELLLLTVYGAQGLTQADIDAETKPSNIHKAVAELLEASADPDEAEAQKKASGLIRTFNSPGAPAAS